MGDEEQEQRNAQTWARLMRENALRALRFGPRPERQQKREAIWQDPHKRKLEPRTFDTVSLTPPARLEQYLDRFAAVFGRRDTLRQAMLYVIGLLSGLSRKNGETMEAAVPGASQESIYNFMVRSRWSAEELDRVRVLDALDRAGGKGQPVDGIIDECGWRKKGRLSVGVARQYLGSLGKTDNGQVIVSVHLCCGEFDVPGTAELYMPEKQWGGDNDASKERRAAAKVPAGWVFRTKPALALALLLRVRAWGLQLRRVHGDCGYSGLATILGLLNLGLEIALGVRGNDTVRLAQEPWLPAVPPPPYSGHGRPRQGQPSRPHLHTPDELRARLAADCWQPVAYRQDVNGERLIHEFVAVRAHVVHTTKRKQPDSLPAGAESPELWLLLERPCGPGPHRPDDVKQYVLSGPDTMRLDQLAQIAHVRPLIERDSYENAKQEAGLADYQGRSWIGLHHHLAIVWLTLTWQMLMRLPLPPRPPAFSQPVAPPPSAPAGHGDGLSANETTPHSQPASSPAPFDSASGPDPASPADSAPAQPSADLPPAGAPTPGTPPSDPTAATAAAHPIACPDPAPPTARPLAAASAATAQPPADPLGSIPIARLASSPLPLPRQCWESVQQVRRSTGEWFRGMRAHELFFEAISAKAVIELLQTGALKPLPVLAPLLSAGP